MRFAFRAGRGRFPTFPPSCGASGRWTGRPREPVPPGADLRSAALLRMVSPRRGMPLPWPPGHRCPRSSQGSARRRLSILRPAPRRTGPGIRLPAAPWEPPAAGCPPSDSRRRRARGVPAAVSHFGGWHRPAAAVGEPGAETERSRLVREPTWDLRGPCRAHRHGTAPPARSVSPASDSTPDGADALASAHGAGVGTPQGVRAAGRGGPAARFPADRPGHRLGEAPCCRTVTRSFSGDFRAKIPAMGWVRRPAVAG